jgi:hypothetical protein
VLAGASSDGFVDRTRRNRSEKLDWRAACGICVSSQNACARPSSCDAPVRGRVRRHRRLQQRSAQHRHRR